MAVRDILILPDKRLRTVSKPVAKIDAATRKLVEEMFETMYAAPGIGLAAIQIGEPKRVVTMDLAKKDEPKQPQVFINPELIDTVDPCMSLLMPYSQNGCRGNRPTRLPYHRQIPGRFKASRDNRRATVSLLPTLRHVAHRTAARHADRPWPMRPFSRHHPASGRTCTTA